VANPCPQIRDVTFIVGFELGSAVLRLQPRLRKGTDKTKVADQHRACAQL
jgi:hypothetical protein